MGPALRTLPILTTRTPVHPGGAHGGSGGRTGSGSGARETHGVRSCNSNYSGSFAPCALGDAGDPWNWGVHAQGTSQFWLILFFRTSPTASRHSARSSWGHGEEKRRFRGKARGGGSIPGLATIGTYVPYEGQEAGHGRKDIRPAMGGRLRHWFDGGIWYHS